MKRASNPVASTLELPVAASGPGTLMTGTFVGVARGGAPIIDVGGRQCQASSCTPLYPADIGRQVVAMIAPSDPDGAIVVGIVRPANIDLSVDGKSVTVVAEECLTLKCGDASITLNRDGKVVIRGAHVVSHAAGVNRIRGGSIEMN